METVSIVVVITITFAAANLFVQMAALDYARRAQKPGRSDRAIALEHPFHSRIEGMPRMRTDRHDLLLAVGHDFAATDVEESVWPRDPRV